MNDSIDPRPSIFQRHRKKTLFAVVIVLIAVADVSGTLILRWTGLYVPESRLESTFRCSHPIYHHGLRPSSRSHAGASWGQRKYDVFTNSLGFKDRATREVALQPTKKRLVVIGDSFTEGIGIEYPETFVGVMDTELADDDVEVLNAGVTTYSPIIYYRKCLHLIEEVGLRFDHLVVCLDLSDIVDEAKYYREDEAGNVVRDGDGVDDVLKQFIRRNTILANAVRQMLHDFRKSAEVEAQAKAKAPNPVVDHPRSAWTRDPALWEQYGKRGIELSDLYLSRLHDLLERHGIKMSLVVYPWPDQIIYRERDCVQVTHWRDWCAKHGVSFINLFPAFLDAGDPQLVVESNFIPGDMHWNERGHAVIAKGLLEALDV